jgi:hypothetical protein
VEKNAEVLSNPELLINPEGILSFCRARFEQIRELVENTDTARIIIDFPRYIHRLRHLVTRLRHLLQFGKMETQLQPSAQTFAEELQRFLEHISEELRTSEGMRSVPTFTAEAAPFVITQGRTEPVSYSEDNLRNMNVISDRLDTQDVRPQLANQTPSSNLLGSFGGGFGAPFAFAKLANPIEKMLADLGITDGLDVGTLLKFLRVLVRLRDLVGMSRFPPSQILQVFYGFTKGALASKTIAAIHRGDTLDAYHHDVLAFFIPPRAMLPLLQSEYFRPQRPGEPLSVYVANIKEMAAVLRQDADEAAVVRTILDGLNPRERNRLVFCDRPRNYADLDNMCVYAHNIPYSDNSNVSDSGLRITSHAAVAPGNSSVSSPGRNPLVCYYCNNPGHTRRDCRARLSAGSSPASQGNRSAP